MSTADYELILKNIRKKYEGNNAKNDNDRNNLWEEIRGINKTVKDSFLKGVIGAGEQIVDLGASLAGNIGNAFGADTSAIENFVKRDLTSDFMNTKAYNFLSSGSLPDIIDFFTDNNKGLKQSAEMSMSYAPKAKEVISGVSQSIGNMLPSIAATSGLGSIGVAPKVAKGIGMAEFGAQAMGGSIQEGLNQGANLGTATMYGALEGTKEVATELFVDKILPGGDLYNKVLGVEKTASKGVGTIQNIIKDYISMGVNEGAEEVVGDLFDPLIEKITINKNMTMSELGSRYDITNKENLEQWAMDFITGALSGMVMGSTEVAQRVRNFGVEGYNLQSTINEAHELVDNVTELERTGKLTENERLNFQNRMTELSNDYANQMEALEKKYNINPNEKNSNRLDNAKSYNQYMKDVASSSIQDLTTAKQFEDYNRKNKNKNKLNYVSLDANDYKKYLESLTNSNIKLAETSNAYTLANGDIVVNKDSASYKNGTLYNTIGHELTHRLENLNGYNSMFNDYFKNMSKEELNNKIKEKMNVDSTLTKYQAKKEIFADYIGNNIINNPQALDRILGNKPTLRRVLFGNKGVVRNALEKKIEGLVNESNKVKKPNNNLGLSPQYSIDYKALAEKKSAEALEKTKDTVYYAEAKEWIDDYNANKDTYDDETLKFFYNKMKDYVKNAEKVKSNVETKTTENVKEKETFETTIAKAYEVKENVDINGMSNDELAKHFSKICNILADSRVVTNEINSIKAETDIEKANEHAEKALKMLKNYKSYLEDAKTINQIYKKMSVSEQMRFDNSVDKNASKNFTNKTVYDNARKLYSSLVSEYKEAKSLIGNSEQASINKFKTNLNNELTRVKSKYESLPINDGIQKLEKEISSQINSINTPEDIFTIDNMIKKDLVQKYEDLKKDYIGVEPAKKKLTENYKNAKSKLEEIKNNLNEVYGIEKASKIVGNIESVSKIIENYIDNLDYEKMSKTTVTGSKTDIENQISKLLNYYDNYQIDLKKYNSEQTAEVDKIRANEARDVIKNSGLATDTASLYNRIRNFNGTNLNEVNKKLDSYIGEAKDLKEAYTQLSKNIQNEYNFNSLNINELNQIKIKIESIDKAISKLKERQNKLSERNDKIELAKQMASNKDQAKRAFTAIETAQKEKNADLLAKNIEALRNNILRNFENKLAKYNKKPSTDVYKQLVEINEYFENSKQLQNEETAKLKVIVSEINPSSTYSKTKEEIKQKEVAEKKKIDEIKKESKPKEEIKPIKKEVIEKIKEVTHVIKDGVRRISTDSQNTVRYWAEAYKEIYYPLDSTKGMFEAVEYTLSNIQDLDSRLIYNYVENGENSKSMVIDRINKLANEYQQRKKVDFDTKVNNITDEICEGLEIKSFDFNADGSLRGRDTYKSYRELQNFNYVKEIREAIRKTVEVSLSTSGQTTNFADRISKAISQANKNINSMQKELDIARDEAFKYFSYLNKANEYISQLKENVKNDKRTLNSLQKKINSMTSSVNLSNTNIEYYDNLKSQINTLKSRLNSLGYENYKLTNKTIKLQSNLVEGREINSSFRYNLQKELKNSLTFKEFKLSNQQYAEVAEYVINKDFDNATKLLYDNIINEMNDYEYKEFVNSDLYNDFSSTIKETIESLYNKGKITPTSRLTEKINKIKEANLSFKETQNTIKSIKTTQKVTSNSFGINSDLVSAFDEVVNIKKVDLLNGEVRNKIRDFMQTYDKIKPEQELNFIERQIIDNYLDNYSDSDVVLSSEIKDTKNVYKVLKDYFKRLHEGRKVIINGVEDTTHNIVKKELNSERKIKKKQKGYKWNKVDAFVASPQTIAYMIDNGDTTRFSSQIMEQLTNDEISRMKYEMDLREGFDKFKKSTKERTNFMSKTLKEKVNIEGVEMTKAEALMIYLTSQDTDGYKHLMDGINVGNQKKTFEVKENQIDKIDSDGNVLKYNKNITKDGEIIHKKGEAKKMITYESQELDNFISQIENLFDDDVSQKFISTFWDFSDNKSRKLLYDTQMKNYGRSNVDMTSDRHYVSLNVSAENRNTEVGNTIKNLDGIENMVAPGFTKSRTSTFGSLDIKPVDRYIENMISRLSKYAAYSNTILTMNDVYNVRMENGENLINSIGERIQTNDGNKKNYTKYVNDLLDDLQGLGTNTTQSDNAVKKAISWLRSKHAVWALGGNLKSIVMQPASIPTAFKYINPRYFAKGMKLWATSKSNQELIQLPTLAKYRTYSNSIVEAQTAGAKIGKVGNFLMKANGATDNFASHLIWYSAYAQEQAKGGTSTDIYSRAEQVYNKAMSTQPNSLNSISNEYQRTDNEILKMTRMYKNQAFQNGRNLYDSARILQFNQKNDIKTTKKQMKAFGSDVSGIVLSGIIATAIGMMFKRLQGKDEDEQDIKSWTEAFLNDNILSMIPILSNFIDLDFSSSKIISTKDFEIPIASIFTDELSYITDAFDSNTNGYKRAKDITYGLGELLGVPTRNLYNYTSAILKQFNLESVYDFDAKWNNTTLSNKSEINKAITSGNETKAKAYYKAYSNNIMKVDNSTLNTMYKLYSSGNTNVFLKTIPSEITFKDGENIATNTKEFAKIYSKLSEKLDGINSNYSFSSLDDEGKSYVMQKLVNDYYQLARKKQSGEALNKFEILTSTDYDMIKAYSYLYKINNISTTNKKTKKQLVEVYINKQPLTAKEKYLLFYLSGYSIPTSKKQLVRGYLRQLGLNNTQIESFLE